jgi:hypothetical protein
MNTVGTTCDDLAWNFFGTPMYEKYHKFMETKSGRHVETCSKEELEELRQRNFRDRGASESISRPGVSPPRGCNMDSFLTYLSIIFLFRTQMLMNTERK